MRTSNRKIAAALRDQEWMRGVDAPTPIVEIEGELYFQSPIARLPLDRLDALSRLFATSLESQAGGRIARNRPTENPCAH